MSASAVETTASIDLDQLVYRQSTIRPASSRVEPLEDVAAASRILDASVPDGGYGWVALAGCGVICFWYVGVSYCWGVLADALVKDGLSTPSTLLWIGSLNAGSMAMFAIPSARIIRALGSRRTALIGMTLFGISQILSGFTVDNIGGLFITAGLATGIASGLCYNLVGSLPAQYFGRKRGLANGIVFACGGLGGAIVSFIMEGLIRRVGTAWTFRVLGLAALATGLPAAWFAKDRVAPSRRAFIDWQLFHDLRFVLLLLAGAIATFPLFVPPFFFPLYSASLGLSAKVGAALVAAFNFSSAAGRIGSGFLADRLGPLNSLTASLLLNGLSVLALWPVSKTLGPLIAFAIINGISAGGFFALIPTVAARAFGSARVGIAFGMLVTSWSPGYLLGAPIAGYILAAYGGQDSGFQAYRPAMYYAGAMTVAATVLVALARFRENKSFTSRL